jgi:hypothetical protein
MNEHIRAEKPTLMQVCSGGILMIRKTQERKKEI